MPKATKTEAVKWRFSPDEYYPCELESVEEVSHDYTNKKTGKPAVFTKWEWKYKIVDGDHEGLTLYGDTPAEYTNDENDKVRAWAETLMGRELDLGEDLDTDLIIGLPCLVSVRNDEARQKKDGTYFYPCPVDEVLPRTTGPSSGGNPWSGGNGEPPF